MLLKQLLESPKTSSNLVIYDPFQELDREELVREVIGLANADVEGPRNILFGVNSGAVDGSGIVGLSEAALADLKKAHRLLSALIEPTLHLAFIFDMINGKLVGALEIDGCNFGPYFVGQDINGSLTQGQCWVREGWKLNPVERADLMNGRAPASAPAEEPAEPIEKPNLTIGFEDDPECELLEVPVPDTSNPPFADADEETRKTSKFKQAIKDTVSTVTTQMLRLGHAGQQNEGEQADGCGEADKVLADAKNHYFYEEKAVHLDLCICNRGSVDVKDISIELGFPRLPDFDVADRLYTSPFDKRSAAEIRNLGYPKVERRKNGIYVRSSLSTLSPDKAQPIFRSALRLAVGPGMQKRKLAIIYTLTGPGEQELGSGRLKIKFGKVAAEK